jgi:hypothetical protein
MATTTAIVKTQQIPFGDDNQPEGYCYDNNKGDGGGEGDGGGKSSAGGGFVVDLRAGVP